MGKTKGTQPPLAQSSKATWNPHNTSIFINVAIKVVESRLRPGTPFEKGGWEKLKVDFAKESGIDYTKLQLKNKWDALKIKWKLWKDLLNKETGLGWSSSKCTVDASDEWWNNKIQINEEYAKLRRKGIEPELEEKLDRMFGNTVATGEHAWTPSSGALPQDDEEASMGAVIPLEESGSSDKTIQALKKDTKKGKKRAFEQVDPTIKNDMKGKKVAGAAELSNQIDLIVEAVKSRSSPTLLKQPIGASSSGVMKKVVSLPECEPPSELWMFATRLFLDEGKREMFSLMKEPHVQLTWLKWEFENK